MSDLLKEEVLENDVVYCERKRWVLFALPFTFTMYEIKESLITIKRGFFDRVEDDCYMYKVQDVKLESSLFERLFGLGTVICYTGDVTDSELRIDHVKNSKDIKNFILRVSEEARLKRRTLHTLDIGALDEV